jgi:SAM-dependent methyltransferase
MTTDEKAKWNEKYSSGLHTSLDPEPFLVSAYDRFLAGRVPGDALDVAGGTGRHALWLAHRGWRVRLIDVSEIGVARTVENAHRLIPGSKEPLLRAEVMDLSHASDLGEEQFDVVMVFFYLQRPLFPVLLRALKAGGLLIYQTYTVEAPSLGLGPANLEYLLQPGELRQAFHSMEILAYHEHSLTKSGAAELVARKRGA